MSAQISLSLIVLSAWDIYLARFFLLLSLAYTLVVPALLLSMLALSLNLQRSVAILIPLFALQFLALLLTGRWCARIDRDIRSGDGTVYSSLLRKIPKSSCFHTPTSPPASWQVISVLISLTVPALGFTPLARLIPLLYTLLTPLLPLLALIVITARRLNREIPAQRQAVPASGNGQAAAPDILGSDRTRPMTGLATPGSTMADQTVAAAADTNPAGWKWTDNNRQALMMDILAGRLSTEEACERFKLPADDLQAWLDDFMRQNQAPADAGREVDDKRDSPA